MHELCGSVCIVLFTFYLWLPGVTGGCDSKQSPHWSVVKPRRNRRPVCGFGALGSFDAMWINIIRLELVNNRCILQVYVHHIAISYEQ